MLNIEGYPSEDFLALVRDVLPEQVTLVPDAENQRTSDQGWGVFKNREFCNRSCPILVNGV